ncbi:MAG TPA: aspartate--tRNA ligase [Solirubrobacterales bacterium]|nr:aspartate--tRNA ligase [Solirubrobacterales bacterium]HMU26933.1 aspartate--tRNA ligase [Solirubrobacterales bacterium]HMX71738.1 aspartate--tRNA ligase [Solirubrobacterales bacterium]HNA23925.1 aspartate--tRNA ligase [Solirubrobacterales bacterium]HNA44443.1 aspartate--tRNA ligase [Solirubrobacterales bacterium]
MSDAPELKPNSYRDTWCGQVLGDKVGGQVRLSGWVHRRRDHGGLIFIDLRDRTGLVQLVFNPDEAGGAHELGHTLRSEYVISVAGEVVTRSDETVNPELPTGEFEVRVKEVQVLAEAETPPFEIEGFHGEVGEEARLKHRYLDLRRDQMQQAIKLRHRLTAAMRSFLDAEGFLDIETPILTLSTPEGARDFLVPSRLQRGSFYALPQSPQLFKQLLMMSGFERYFQIARCFRDEDLRADRQPDFTQLDIEMSFVTGEDVIEVNERLIRHVLAEMGVEVEIPFERMCYDEAIGRFGSDKPDLRYGYELTDLTEILRGTEFKAFGGVIEGGGQVKGINFGQRELSRAQLDGLIDDAKELGAKGLVWAFREGDGWRAPIAKFLSEGELKNLNEAMGAEEGDLMLVAADQPAMVAAILGGLRTRLAERWDLIPADAGNRFCWIVDWPLFEFNEEEDRWDALHHPFTAPKGDFDPENPGEARAEAYDLVWNGVEIGGGSIRINQPELQSQIFRALGISDEEAEERFGFLLEALRYGAPPHGGIAYGVDRFAALLAGVESIRDVIAFPKTASGGDPLTGAPAPIDDVQMRDVGIELRKKKLPGQG